MSQQVEVSEDRLMAVVTPLDAIIASGFRGGDFQPERGRYGNWTKKSTRTVMFATAEHERAYDNLWTAGNNVRLVRVLNASPDASHKALWGAVY